MTLHDLGQWYYLIYLLPLGLSLVMVLAMALGGMHRGGHSGIRVGHGHGGMRMGHGHGGHGVRMGHAHARGGMHKGAASHARHTGTAKGSATKEGQTEGTAFIHPHAIPHGPHPLLAFFGIGQVPGMLLAQGFCLFWGAFGFYLTRMFEEQGRPPALFILPTLGISAFSGVVGAKFMAAVGSRLMPTEESSATEKEDLLGLIGTAVFPVSETMGRVHVYDSYGTLHDESARLCPDQTAVIARGEQVLLVDYDEAARCYRVEPSPV
jgi:membrane protein implicated in regulation of membrane protease activity